MDLLQGLEAFFDDVPLSRGDCLVAGFSGGGDSTALLLGLSLLAPRRGIDILAAHLDHGIDTGSAARAVRAAALARDLGVPLVSERRDLSRWRRAGESLEAGARRVRYRFFEEVRRSQGGRYVATAHHREDQAETVLLRIAGGSGLRGLAAIRPVSGRLVRPLLAVPRAALRAAVAAAGLEPVEDPGNADPRQPRSRIRHHILPALARHDRTSGASGRAGEAWASASAVSTDAAVLDELAERLARLAARTRRALAILDRRLAAAIDLRIPAPATGLTPREPDATAATPPEHQAAAGLPPGPEPASGMDAPWHQRQPAAAEADRRRLAELPAALLPHAMALLHQVAGAPYPAGRAAVGELRRQLQATTGPRLAASSMMAGIAGEQPSRRPGGRVGWGARIACDCGGGWRWLSGGDSVRLRRARPGRDGHPSGAAGDPGQDARRFTYTLEAPGELILPEIAVRIRVSEAPVEAWMWHGEPHRVGLALPLMALTAPEVLEAFAAGLLTVRNRRAGDRLRPLGSPGSRKLKEVLIDRGVPRWQRDRLPLLCWAGEIAWVPGVTIDHRFRLTGQATVWLAEVQAAALQISDQCPTSMSSPAPARQDLEAS